jgi:cytoskeletal protein CcmA (bactofilin family)
MKKRSDQMNAFLGKDTEFEGRLSFSGAVRIDGSFKGEIFTEGTLIVGETANLESDIHASHVIISGEVRGNITAEKRLEVHAPAKVTGNIQAPVVTIDEGVIFDGNCQMQKYIEESNKNKKVAVLTQSAGSKNED